MSKNKAAGIKIPVLALVMASFFCLSPLYGQRNPINVNLIVDGSTYYLNVRDEVSSWISNKMDQILVEGDSVKIWSAGSNSRIIYEGKINSASDRETVKKSVREITASGDSTDFSSALREAAQHQGSSFTYTLLVSASSQGLSSVLNSSNAGLMRFSRIEEFSAWRAVVVGLNLDSRVSRAASAFFSVQ
ncbi:MAG: hypothetical protein FWC19_07780 [Treponema sp.]|nr:hypothetical protein [Treponema sp.]MCL2272681.1 hypothetical protein [Treponema sp.]